MGGDVDGAVEPASDDYHGGIGGDAANVGDEGGQVLFSEEFFLQGFAGGNVQVGSEDVVSLSFDDVPG